MFFDSHLDSFGYASQIFPNQPVINHDTDVCVSRTCPACVSSAIAWVGRLQPILHHGQQLFNLTAYTTCEGRGELEIERIFKNKIYQYNNC